MNLKGAFIWIRLKKQLWLSVSPWLYYWDWVQQPLRLNRQLQSRWQKQHQHRLSLNVPTTMDMVWQLIRQDGQHLQLLQQDLTAMCMSILWMRTLVRLHIFVCLEKMAMFYGQHMMQCRFGAKITSGVVPMYTPFRQWLRRVVLVSTLIRVSLTIRSNFITY